MPTKALRPLLIGLFAAAVIAVDAPFVHVQPSNVSLGSCADKWNALFPACDSSFTFYSTAAEYCAANGEPTAKAITYTGNSQDSCTQTYFNVISSLTGYCDANNDFVSLTDNLPSVQNTYKVDRSEISKWTFCTATSAECKGFCACRKTYSGIAFCVKASPKAPFVLYNTENLNLFCGNYGNKSGIIIKKLPSGDTNCFKVNDDSENSLEPQIYYSATAQENTPSTITSPSAARYRKPSSVARKVAAAIERLSAEDKQKVIASIEHSKAVLSDITSAITVNGHEGITIDNSTNVFIEGVQVDAGALIEFIQEMLEQRANTFDGFCEQGGVNVDGSTITDGFCYQGDINGSGTVTTYPDATGTTSNYPYNGTATSTYQNATSTMPVFPIINQESVQKLNPPQALVSELSKVANLEQLSSATTDKLAESSKVVTGELSNVVTDKLSELSKNVVGEQLSSVIGDKLSELSTNELSSVAADKLSEVSKAATGEQLSSVVADKLSEVSKAAAGEQLSSVVADKLSEVSKAVSGEQLSSVVADKLSEISKAVSGEQLSSVVTDKLSELSKAANGADLSSVITDKLSELSKAATGEQFSSVIADKLSELSKAANGVELSSAFVDKIVELLKNNNGDQLSTVITDKLSELSKTAAGEQVLSMAANKLSELSKNVVGEQLSSVIGDKLSELSTNELSSVAADKLSEVSKAATGEQLSSVVADKLSEVSKAAAGEQLSSVVADKLSEVSKAVNGEQLPSSITDFIELFKVITEPTNEIQTNAPQIPLSATPSYVNTPQAIYSISFAVPEDTGMSAAAPALDALQGPNVPHSGPLSIFDVKGASS